MADQTPEQVLEEIGAEVRRCTACRLCEKRTKAVPGEGALKSGIMFIGEGPGFHEDRQGRPFVGQAGKLLEEMLAAVGLRREQVYITNVVKCRPPGNRDPQPDEIAACNGYLDRQLAAIDPRIVVTLGRFSLARFFPGSEDFRRSRRAQIRRWSRLRAVLPSGGRPAHSSHQADALRGCSKAARHSQATQRTGCAGIVRPARGGRRRHRNRRRRSRRRSTQPVLISGCFCYLLDTHTSVDSSYSAMMVSLMCDRC